MPRAIVDLPTDDPADIILVGGLAASGWNYDRRAPGDPALCLFRLGGDPGLPAPKDVPSREGGTEILLRHTGQPLDTREYVPN